MPPKKPKPKEEADAPVGNRGNVEEPPPSPPATTSASSNNAAEQSRPEDTDASATPGGTPAPARRLGSLNRPSPAAAPRGRGGTVAKPKFTGRRSQAARAELEKEEAAKKAAEAEAQDNARKPNRFGQGDRGGRGRGRGGRGRGRGGYMGESQRAKGEVIASGPFSAGQVSHDARSSNFGRSGWGSGGGSGVFGGGTGPRSGGWSGSRDGGSSRTGGGSSSATIKTEGADGSAINGIGRMRSIKAEDGGYISSDDEGEDGVVLKRQNIDELQSRTIDLTGDGDPAADDAFAPVRLKRVPVKDRTVGLSAEELSKRPTESGAAADISDDEPDKRKGKARAQDFEITGSSERRRRPAAYSSSDEAEDTTKVKKEPVDDGEDTNLQSVRTTALTTLDDARNIEAGALQDAPSSPEAKRKAKEKIKATAGENVDDDQEFQRPRTPPYPTQQEVDEFHRYWDELKIIASELGRIAPKSTAAEADGAEDVKMTDVTTEPSTSDAALAKASKPQSVRSDHVYLFQFPPVLPDLHPVAVKPDPEASETTNGDGEAMDVDRKEPKDSKDNVAIKIEEGQPANPQPQLASGRVGKLRVHKSGKTTLDWGGTSFVLGMGADATFLQNVMIAKIPEAKVGAEAGAESEEVARGMGMGQVRGKFVLTPNWDEMLS